MHVCMYVCMYMGAFFEGYKFCEWTKKGSLRKLFSRIYIGVSSSFCNPCHDRIFTNF